MSSLCILYHLNRSNPMIFRAAALPDHFPLTEVGELCCLTLGLKSTACYYELIGDETNSGNIELAPGIKSADCDYELNKDETNAGNIELASGMKSADCDYELNKDETNAGNIELAPGMKGVVRLAKDSQSIKHFALDVAWSVSENMDHSENASAISYPILKDWLGYQLPAGIFSVAMINEMQAAFQTQSNYQLSTGEILYRDPLLLVCQKTNNAICMRYVPDLARPEIKMELGLPLIDLLETMTLADIKNQLDRLHQYGYSAEKKANCAKALAFILCRESADQIFGRMELNEYLNFRKFVLSGSCDCLSNEDLSNDFPVLWEACRIRFVKKVGVRIAAEVLQSYSQWFDSQKETAIRKNKMLRQAMRWCSFYYGIFSLDHCWQVLQTVYPGQVQKEDLTAYWQEFPDFADAENVRFSDDSYRKHSLQAYAYDPSVISGQDLNYYLQAVQNDTSRRKLPSDRASFEVMAAKCLDYAGSDPQILKIQRNYIYFYYETNPAVQRVNESIQKLRGGSDLETEVKDVVKHLHWYTGCEEQGKIMIADYLREEAEVLPQFQYYGFSRKEIAEQNIVSDLSAKVTALKEEAVEKKRLRRNITNPSGRRRR